MAVRHPIRSTLCTFSLLLAMSPCSSQARTHKPSLTYNGNRCGGTPSGWSAQGSEYGELMVHNSLRVERGRFTWNGATVSSATIQMYLAQMKSLHPSVSLQVVFDRNAGCGLVNRVRRVVDQTLHCGRGQRCIEYSKTEWQARSAGHVVY